MQEEYEALIRNGAWTLIDFSSGRKAIRSKWIYKTKLNAYDRPAQYKVRLVSKGSSQRKGEDYEETYCPVVRHSSLWYLFAMAARWNLEIDPMDAITAFLQRELSEEIFVMQPAYYEDSRNKSKAHQGFILIEAIEPHVESEVGRRNKEVHICIIRIQLCVYYRITSDKFLFAV